MTSSLSYPTGFEVEPDISKPRIFVTEQTGSLRVIKDGVLLARPFVTVVTDNTNERGLLGVALPPDFGVTNYVYIYYTVPTSPPHNRLSRYTAVGDVAAVGSEEVILELDDLNAPFHNGGALRFGEDGKLYIGVGDNQVSANSQTLGNLKGKLLRINPDGSIPTDNPFYGVASGKNRAIWALGLRNPFTFDVQPQTGRIFIDDVGRDSWEEINEGIAGANYGWPTTEGYTNDPRYVSPLFAYPHGTDNTFGCAITGGTFYNPPVATFPSAYIGKYFFQDFCNGWIRVFDPDTSSDTSFATGLQYESVSLRTGPDGSLYYVYLDPAPANSALYQIQYTGVLGPQIGSPPVDQTVSVGESPTFSVSAYGSNPLSYQWQHSTDGGASFSDIAGANSASYTLDAATLANDGTQFRVVVSNSLGNITSRAAALTVTSNTRPVGIITSPPAGTVYRAGDVIQFAGTATDAEDGSVAPSALSWEVHLQHHVHFHPFIPPTTGIAGGSFTIPNFGETSNDAWYRIFLTVTDSGGLSQTSFRDVLPRKSTITIVTAPPGLQFTIDGEPQTAPYSTLSVVGMLRTLAAMSPPQNVGGVVYAFDSWSDGGAAVHAIATLDQDATYTLTYQSCPAVTWENLVGVAATGNSIQKTASSSVWDAGASSRQAILSGDGHAMVVADGHSNSRTFGLSSDDTHQGWWDIDFALIMQDRLRVYEYGTFKGVFDVYATGDILKVALESGVVRYYRNGSVFYTSTSPPPGYPLVVDTSLLDPGSVIQNAAVCGGSLGVVTAPAITSAPSTQTVLVGQSAVFSVGASGDALLTYRWQRNGADISGATQSMYNLPSVSLSDSGAEFRCIVTNRWGSAMSDAAILTVLAPTGPPTESPTPTATPTPLPTNSAPPTATATPTGTLTPSASQTSTPSKTASSTPTTAPTVAITPTSTHTPNFCVGDCSGDGQVTVNELITMVDIALVNTQPTCAHGIPAGANVDVSLIVRAVNNALSGCP